MKLEVVCVSTLVFILLHNYAIICMFIMCSIYVLLHFLHLLQLKQQILGFLINFIKK